MERRRGWIWVGVRARVKYGIVLSPLLCLERVQRSRSSQRRKRTLLLTDRNKEGGFCGFSSGRKEGGGTRNSRNMPLVRWEGMKINVGGDSFLTGGGNGMGWMDSLGR